MPDESTAARTEDSRSRFHVIAKPIGARCNLDCVYCYYLPKQKLLADGTDRLSESLLEEFIRQYITTQDAETIYFSWHGGEPTLLGLDYFENIIRLQQKYAGSKDIKNSLQTNGVLLDDAWCQFFKKHDFLIGISIDGPRYLHDHFRIAHGGQPTFDRVCNGVRLLQQHDVSFNTLTVVNAITARHPEEVYRFFVEELGCWRLQWLPCVERKQFRTVAPGQWDTAMMPMMGTPAARPRHPDSVVTDWSVDPDDWGEFLCQTFYWWAINGAGKVRVNWFESLVGQLMEQPAQICTLAGACPTSLAIEKDGSLFPCDHLVYPEYRLGSLQDKDCQLSQLVHSPQQQKFRMDKRDTLPDYCRRCQYTFACNGDCPKNRFIKTPDGEPGLSYLCSGIKRFLTYAEPSLHQIVDKIVASGCTAIDVRAQSQKVDIPKSER